MAKTDVEIAADLVQELIRSRAVAISNFSGTTTGPIKSYVEELLAAERVAEDYKKILETVRSNYFQS